MRRNRILYILMVLAFLVFSIAYQSRISSVLLIAAAVYPLLAALAAFIASRTAEAGFIEQREVHPKETDIEIWLYVRSRFRWLRWSCSAISLTATPVCSARSACMRRSRRSGSAAFQFPECTAIAARTPQR